MAWVQAAASAVTTTDFDNTFQNLKKLGRNADGSEPPTQLDALMETAIEAVRESRLEIERRLRETYAYPDSAEDFRLFLQIDERTGSPLRQTKTIDVTIEALCKRKFEERHGRIVQVVGEETLHKFKAWSGEYGVLLDVVDGTDLVEMGIDLWCSAITIYGIQRREILGAVVGLPTGEIYCARIDRNDGAPEVIERDASRSMRGPSHITRLVDAGVAFYGQKMRNFLGMAAQQRFMDYTRKVTARMRGAKLRLYNFAGNPIAVRLADRLKDRDENHVLIGVDAIFDTVGQKLHDIAPGAYIAMNAKAYVWDLERKEQINAARLSQLLENPRSNQLRYVIAATKELAQELAKALKLDDRT